MSRVLPFLAVFSLAACSSSSTNPTTTDSGATDTGTSGTDTATDETPSVPCSEPMDMWPEGSQCLKTVSGKVLDATGAPVAGKTISVCGSICFYATTKADGSYLADVGSHIVVTDFAASVHGRPEFASLFVRLPSTTADTIALPDMIVPKLPDMGQKIPFDADNKITAATEVTNGDVTLQFAAGTKVELDVEDVLYIDMPPKNGDQLRVTKVEEKDFPAFAKDAGVKVLYAASPFDSKYDQKVGLKIANTGLADGDVDIVILGDEFLKKPFTAGSALTVAAGKASGGTVTTNTGEGIQVLTWIGIKPK